MAAFHDGPVSPLFTPVRLKGNGAFNDLARFGVSEEMARRGPEAPTGRCTSWGIPFQIDKPLVVQKAPVSLDFAAVRARWLVFLHTTDMVPLEWNEHGFITASRGTGRLGEHVADYVIVYADGSEVRQSIRRRHEVGMFQRHWGENCACCVAHRKPYPIRPFHEQAPQPPDQGGVGWGWYEARTANPDNAAWVNFLYAWENPHWRKDIVGVRIEPKAGTLLLSALSAGMTSTSPIRWQRREKAVLKLPKSTAFDPRSDDRGLWSQVQLDLGQVIYVRRRTRYPDDDWSTTYNNQTPEVLENELLVEYTAHPDAQFHLWDGKTASAARLTAGLNSGPLAPVGPAYRRVRLRVVEADSKKPVAVKLHVHGEAGEYLAPVDRHRLPNPAWFEDYSADFLARGTHLCTYIPGETTIDLPLGTVYIEVSKGYEIKPVRKTVRIAPGTKQITIPLRKVLPWRERGWVTADTHVHFLSPPTARLEGEAEGVNVVNLLASQWGELMTNVGDFDGKTTFGSREAGGDGEWLVRVGTENRQHVMGHISLLGYHGDIIAPMTTGGPDEAAIGDPVEILLTEWAMRCRRQGGLVVMPHFPNPRLENAAAILSGHVDAVEMTSWGNLYGGIDPYSLSDWYRYLNCGRFVPACGGTDKMSATTPVGCVRTYARLPEGRAFDYEAWKGAVRTGHTFVTYGPLLEFAVEGKPAGSWIELMRSGGTLDVAWEVASVTVPMTHVDLVVNGEIRERQMVKRWSDEGHWSLKVDKSSWVALLVRGQLPDRPEIIAAHSSPVMVRVAEMPFFAAADALTILDQIEGALAYLDTVATRADAAAYKRMRLQLTSLYRNLHNELHKHGHDHLHTHATDHAAHHA